MKGKSFIVTLSLILSLALLAACGNSAQPQGENSPPQGAAQSETGQAGPSEASGQSGGLSVVTEPLNLTLAAGSAGGASQAIGEAIGEAIKRTVPGTSFTYQPSQYGANAPLVGQGKVELGMDYGEFTYWASQGTEVYNQPYPNLRVIAFLHHTAWSMAVQKDTGITSIEQIVAEQRPLKLTVNTKNSGLEYPNRWVFAEYGFSYEDIEAWGGTVNYSPSKEAGDLFKDRKLDSVAYTAQQPLSFFYDFYKAVPVTWLEPSPEVVEKVIQSHQSLQPYTIPAEMYADVGLTEDYETFSMPMFLLANAEMPDEVAYTIAKALYDHFEYLHSANDVLRDLTEETIVPQAGVPIHPGAEAFYKEVGLLK